MIRERIADRRVRARVADPRVGLFGLLGAGNLGNDGSLESVLAYLESQHPDAVLGCLCSGPERVRTRYGIPATSLHWYDSYAREVTGIRAGILKAAGKAIDAVRTLRWIRKCDVVIVPGTGILETTLPQRPWGTPYALFLLCLAGKIVGTKVALVNVGASVVRQRVTRWLYRSAAELAYYRSFRDTFSRDAMAHMGLDTSDDEVFPDLVFALPSPSPVATTGTSVGLGLMNWHGGNDDRSRADAIRTSYIDGMKQFSGWLIDHGYDIRFLIGDHLDESVVNSIVSHLRARSPNLAASRTKTESANSLTELMEQIAKVDIVVATRYHNVLCSLKLAKPTLSISYSAKSDRLMDEMGLADFCHSAHAVDVGRLIGQFMELRAVDRDVAGQMLDKNLLNAERLSGQYSVLSAKLFPAAPDYAGVRRSR